MSRFSTFFRAHARIVRFVIVGGTAAAINIGVLFVLTHYVGIWYLASESLAFVIALCYNFLLQKFWTFGGKRENRVNQQSDQLDGKQGDTGSSQRGAAARQGFLFVVINLFNLALNTLILYALVQFLGIWYIAAQVIAAVVIAFESYFMYRKIF